MRQPPMIEIDVMEFRKLMDELALARTALNLATTTIEVALKEEVISRDALKLSLEKIKFLQGSN